MFPVRRLSPALSLLRLFIVYLIKCILALYIYISWVLYGKTYKSMNSLPVYFRRHCAIFMYLTEVSWSSAGITTIIQPTTFACFKGLDVAFDTLHLACSAAGIGIHALSAPLQSTHRPDSSLYRWKCHRNYLDYISISLSNLRHRYPSLLEILIVFWVQLSDLASPLESRS